MGLKQEVDDAMQRICAGSVSTHALRGESDREPSNLRYTDTYFNPRPPRGGRPGTSMPRSSCIRFQSTFSMQRVTVQMLLLLLMFGISTHIFREEGDVAGHRRPTPHRKFQSTPSARRATKVTGKGQVYFVFQSTPSARRATQRPDAGAR